MNKNKNKCKYCGKDVKCKFCNTSCQNKYIALIRKQKYDSNPKFCINCGKPLSWTQRNGKFCSHSCSAMYTNKNRGPHSEETKQKIRESIAKIYKKHPKSKKLYKCVVCGNEYYYEKGVSTKKCCSNECSIYFRTNRKEFLSNETLHILSEAGKKSVYNQKDTRRSKNEIYFYELCSKEYNNVVHNEPIFNGWDADVIIHDIKVAVLWNGPWHYKEISKSCSLKQIQNRDIIKLTEIEKIGYTPYIIKDMGKYNKEFVENEFYKFLSIYNIKN